MNRRTKKLAIAILATVLLIAVATVSNAYSATATLTSSSKLAAGSQIVVNVGINPTDVGDGIDSIEATLDYDKDVLELDESDVVSAEGWREAETNVENGKVVISRRAKVNTATAVFTATFKVKDSISVDSTVITLKDVILSGGRVEDGGTGDVEVSAVNITISKAAEPETNTPTPTPSNSTPTPTTTKPITAVQNDTTKATTTKLPQTGVSYTVVAAIAVVALVGAISYLRYRSFRIVK